MTIASRLGRIIGLLALATALAACSAIKLGYNNIDGLAYWWLDSYLDFTDEQEGRVREDLDRLHAWHRASELPQFVALLQAMEQAAPADVTPAQACGFLTQVQQRLEALSERAEPAVVTLVLGLTSEQLTHLERKYEKVNKEFRKDWIQPAASEIAEKRLEKFIERSEMIYGKLDDAQRAAVRRQLQQSSFDGKRLLAERQRRQRDTLQTLRKVTGQPIPLDEARALMRAYLDRQRLPADPGDRVFQQSLIDEACANAAALHNSTTAAQREAGARRLRAYQRDLRELSARR
jgi:hypothetical protein